MCDEIGSEGTLHTHIYIEAENPIKFQTVKKMFYHAHIESAKGTAQQNRDYIRKEGRYINTDKKETNLSATFEEWGEMPLERKSQKSQSEQIVEMIKSGANDVEILEAFPSAYSKFPHIERVRQKFLEERFKSEFRKVDVVYIWGSTGVGKTRKVMEEFGYENVYKVTNYLHPFDNYKGQGVILFDEFRSSLPLKDMLQYVDGYPCMLPARYSDKVACFTKVFIVSNIPFEKQYPNIQIEEPESWMAFKRRISDVLHMSKVDELIKRSAEELNLVDFEEIVTDDDVPY